jgi:hypothetical protein
LNMIFLDFTIIPFSLSFSDGIICLSRCLRCFSHKVRATTK